MLWFFLVLYFSCLYLKWCTKPKNQLIYLSIHLHAVIWNSHGHRTTTDWKHILSEIKNEGGNSCLFLPASSHNLNTATSTPMQRFCEQNPLTVQQSQNRSAPGQTQNANAVAAVMCFKEVLAACRTLWCCENWQVQNIPGKSAKWGGAEGQPPLHSCSRACTHTWQHIWEPG